ncbi:MAG: dienelactone hydrolase family protein [Alphaproteobacteria bacterium]|nr:dienelactone hydrolase family protein [Alphaproteobacteria bacterium]
MTQKKRRSFVIPVLAGLGLGVLLALSLLSAKSGVFDDLNPKIEGTIQQTRIADLTVSYWQPNPLPLQPAPVIIFSHGVRGCGTSSQYLMEALARGGYMVFAPDHQDSSCSGVYDPAKASIEFFVKSELWDVNTYRDRGEDIRKLVAALKQDPQWAARVDFSKIGLLGYSLGGYTVLGLSGAWPEWKLEGVKAVLAQAPYTTPLIEKGQLDKLNIPVMYQLAMWDAYLTDHVKQPGGAYDKTPSPVWLLQLDKIDHDGFSDFKKSAARAEERIEIQKDILYYTLWFFDRTLKGVDESLKKRPNIVDQRSK